MNEEDYDAIPGARSEEEPPDPPTDEVWSDPEGEETVSTGQLVLTRKPTPEQAQQWRMQSKVLYGVGLIFFVSLFTVVGGTGLGMITGEFASELARMIIPTVLGSASTIIGVLFVAGKKQQ